MDLSLQIVPVDNTTPREISAASRDLRGALDRLQGVIRVEPQRVAAPDHSKGGLVEVLGGLLVSVAPAVLSGLMQALQTVLSYHPATKVLIQTKDGQVSFEFDPKRISLRELVSAAERLGAAAPSA